MSYVPLSAGTEPARRAASASASRPSAVLGLREVILLIVGVVIGAGIFKAPSMVTGMAGSTALDVRCLDTRRRHFADRCAVLRRAAHGICQCRRRLPFLKRAYGRTVSFLFGWARFSVITTGSIALLAFVFGDYMQQALPLSALGGATGSAVYAVAAIAVLSWVNLRGIKAGTSAQTWLTVLEVAGLLLIVVAALFLAGTSDAAPVAASASAPGPAATFGLAMVFVLLTYGGWNEAAYISAELKDRQRNMVKALVLSILIITTLYLLVTWAYWRGLGLEGMARSEALAADLMKAAFGTAGEKIISALVAIAALTSINATMIVGARTSYAMGRDWPALGKLALWDSARGTPVHAMRAQSAAALLLVLLGAWTGSGFKAMVEFTAPVFWLFFLLSGLALFVLRVREPEVERPFRVPLYPLLPLIFCVSCAYMLWSSLSYVYSQSLGGLNAAWIGVGVLLAGAVLLWLVSRFPAKHSLSPNP